jgi:hypothetical protein
MTLTKFNQTRWGKGMFARYCGQRYLIVQVDLLEALIGLGDPELLDHEERYPNAEISWARCENVDLIDN